MNDDLLRLSRRRCLALGLAVPAMPARAAGIAAGILGSALVMGTGRPGGDYVLYGPAWGRLIRQQTGIGVAYQASGGAQANILLIDEKAAQLGLTTTAIAHEARQGLGRWTGGAKFTSFRALFPAFPSILQIVSLRKTGITTLAGLAGQRIGVGPVGSSGNALLPALFKTVGIFPGEIRAGDYGSQIRDMQAGLLAACAFIAAAPAPAITRIAMRQELSLIGFSAAEARQAAMAVPGTAPATLGAGLFPGQTNAVRSIGTSNIAIADANLPDSLAKAVTIAALKHQAALAGIVPAAAAMPDIAPIAEAGIPFHPGAAEALNMLGLTRAANP